MEDPQDVTDLLGTESFAGARPGPDRQIPVPDSVRVGDVTFRGRERDPHDSCGGTHRVPAGGGYWSGEPNEDLCSWCYEVERADPHRSPSAHEHVAWARAGIGPGGEPCFVLADDDPAATVARLAELVAAGQLPRIALEQGPRLGDWLESGGVLPDGAVVRRSGVPMLIGGMRLGDLERQLRGELAVPPLDPGLVARIEAAKDERGVIHDPALADEYFAAIQAQGDEHRRRQGHPEPTIEQGQVFPDAPDGDPLG